MNLWERGYNDYLVLENSLFGAVKLIKNADDIDKYKYFGCGIRSGRCRTFSVPVGFCRNVIIFGVDLSSSAYIDIK